MGRHPSKRKPVSRRKKLSNGLLDGKAKTGHSWVDTLRFQPIDAGSSDPPDAAALAARDTISIISWNVLAEAYCSRYSQVKLPVQYQKVVFQPLKRKALLLKVMRDLCRQNFPDVICLQEVDLSDIGELLESLGYVGVETPRVVGGGAGGRTDACAVYVRTTAPASVALPTSFQNDDPSPQWQLVDYELLRLDDLATLSSAPGAVSSPITSNVQGMQMSLLRRNVAVLVRLRHRVSNRTIVLANAHLYWNPGFEYVKLCQAHYILQRVRSFQSSPGEPVVFCGDLNSRPGGTTHCYLTHGFINAKRIAPWYAMHAGEGDESSAEETVKPTKEADDDVNNSLEQHFNGLTIFDGDGKRPNNDEVPRMSYLLDAGLNKLCRWLRILGQDAALETEEEEKLRTGKGEMVIFERCIQERRTLVTTSPRHMQRRDCPSSVYCIHPPFLPKLEVALVHMLLTHGVILEPASFLSRCVVCNGNIVEERDDAEKRRILSEYEAPATLIDGGMAVYECDGCKQGYWWNDLPTSSASRVKTAATRLFELCVRGGVPVRDDNSDTESLFAHVDIPELQKLGWDSEVPGGELLQQKLDFVEWLKQERLECPFELESAYAVKHRGNGGTSQIVGERIPFTNVTHQFVDTLDYIFYDKRQLASVELLHVPTSFVELRGDHTSMENAHLLPSDVWPSDHLAVGTRLMFRVPGEEATKDGNGYLPTSELAIKEVTSSIPTIQAIPDQTDDDAFLYCFPIGSDFVPPPQPPPSSIPTNKATPNQADDEALLYCSPIGSDFVPPPQPPPSSIPTIQATPNQADDEAFLYCSPIGSDFVPPPPPPISALTRVAPPLIHPSRCGCGCIPPILSLFEMAELRKQARLEKRRLA